MDPSHQFKKVGPLDRSTSSEIGSSDQLENTVSLFPKPRMQLAVQRARMVGSETSVDQLSASYKFYTTIISETILWITVSPMNFFNNVLQCSWPVKYPITQSIKTLRSAGSSFLIIFLVWINSSINLGNCFLVLCTCIKPVHGLKSSKIANWIGRQLYHPFQQCFQAFSSQTEKFSIVYCGHACQENDSPKIGRRDLFSSLRSVCPGKSG